MSMCVGAENTAFSVDVWVSLGPVSHGVQASICGMVPLSQTLCPVPQR